LISYTFIKFKSERIFKLYSDLKSYQREYLLNERNDKYSTVMGIILILIMTLLSILILLNDPHLDKIVNEALIRISFKNLSFILSLYLNCWIISIQLIYYELKINYLIIIDSFDLELQRKSYKPSVNIIVMTERIVFKFMKFQYNLKNIVTLIPYFMIINTICLTIIMICPIISYLNYNLLHYGIVFAFIIISNASTFWTIFSTKKVGIIEKNLTQKLKSWQTFGNDENISVELQVLNVTVDQFIHNHKIVEGDIV